MRQAPQPCVKGNYSLLGPFLSYKENEVLSRLNNYEESVVVRFKSNLLLLIFWLHIINYNS
jgi:hypothetical protein